MESLQFDGIERGSDRPLVGEAVHATSATFLDFPGSDKSGAAFLNALYAAWLGTVFELLDVLKIFKDPATELVEDEEAFSRQLVEPLHDRFEILESRRPLHGTETDIAQRSPISEVRQVARECQDIVCARADLPVPAPFFRGEIAREVRDVLVAGVLEEKLNFIDGWGHRQLLFNSLGAYYGKYGKSKIRKTAGPRGDCRALFLVISIPLSSRRFVLLLALGHSPHDREEDGAGEEPEVGEESRPYR
jgi:hypothetical protein